jgi:serine protease inhibitor
MGPEGLADCHPNGFAMRHTLVRAATVALLAFLSACSGGTPATGPEKTTPNAPITELPRVLTASESKLLTATNDFSWSLFKRLSAAQAQDNVFVSPLSASMALGMTMNGASGATYDQMRSTLAFGSATDAEINASYKSLIALLRGLDKTTNIQIANSIWYEKTFPFKQAFLEESKNSFDALVAPLDFKSPASVTTVNNWVSQATAGTINTIIDKIDAEDVMFLVNAIYFKGQWRQKFDVANTKDAVFRGIAGDQPMKLMHRNGDVRGLVRADLAAAELFYGDSAFSMVVVVPQGSNTVDAVAASLNTGGWNTLLGQLHTFKTDVFIPRLKLEWDRTLNDDLIALGMRDAFSDVLANFSRMTSQTVVLSEVKQKSYVEINEEGTTAAAVTSVGVSVTSAPPQIRADRPFIFAIRERLTGTILFMGKIVKMP